MIQTTQNNKHPEYLGDGVYMSFDGRSIWLDLRGQPENYGEICLEPGFLNLLVAYRKRIESIAAPSEETADQKRSSAEPPPDSSWTHLLWSRD